MFRVTVFLIGWAAVVLTPPAKADQPNAPSLGPTDQKLAGYVYAAPAGWTAQQVKGSTSSMMYRSADGSGVILMQVKLKGGAPPEMEEKYAQSVVQLLRQDHAKRKTEVLEAPKAVKDKRFYLKVQEKFRVKPEKTGTQTHLYRVAGRDMIVVTAITTSEKPEEVSAFGRLAEEMALRVKAEN